MKRLLTIFSALFISSCDATLTTGTGAVQETGIATAGSDSTIGIAHLRDAGSPPDSPRGDRREHDSRNTRDGSSADSAYPADGLSPNSSLCGNGQCGSADGCCPNGCNLTNDVDCIPQGPGSCSGGAWDNPGDAPIFAGLGVREPQAGSVYGRTLNSDGAIALPACPYFTGTVRIPVLMIDWHDFDPLTDPSNKNNPSSIPTSYQQTTPTELYDYLNGPAGPAQYFRDVSGGQANLDFHVFGWLSSNANNSYLDARSTYDTQPWLPSKTDWSCDRKAVFKDALRDAVVSSGLHLPSYDADQNGFVDGAVLVYEGGPGLCNGTNLSTLTSSVHPKDHVAVKDLVPASDPNAGLFATQEVSLHSYNNIPDSAYHPSLQWPDLGGWVHELGHLLLGYPDYHAPWNNSEQFALSATSKSPPTHPAAFEKWLFGRWIEPQVISSTGTYTLKANEIPDGTAHDQGTYLYVIYLNGNPNHFLTIENRWFDDSDIQNPSFVLQAPNTKTRWAMYHNRESGIIIFEVNLEVTTFSQSLPQVHRHAPAREPASPMHFRKAWRSGDEFSKCFGSQCITLQPTSDAGDSMTFVLTM